MTNSILEAIRKGKHTQSEIEEEIEMKGHYVSVALSILTEGFVIRETKKGYYLNIKD